MKPAPGTLDADSQTRFMAQLVQLVREAFGSDVEIALALFRYVPDAAGVAVYTMGTAPTTQMLEQLFRIAADAVNDANARHTWVCEEPQARQ